MWNWGGSIFHKWRNSETAFWMYNWRKRLPLASSTGSGKGPNQPQKKKEKYVDYSQTINLYTELDAYHFPRIDKMVNNLAKYKIFSSFDFKSAYHQVPLKVSDRKYTVFEANGHLFQFCRIQFGAKNGAAAFQTAIDRIIEKEKLSGAFPYIDDITIAGCSVRNDQNVKKILRG